MWECLTFSGSPWVALVSSWICWSWCFDMFASQYTITLLQWRLWVREYQNTYLPHQQGVTHITHVQPSLQNDNWPLTDAVRLQLYRIASSPNISPELKVRRSRPAWVTFSSPARMEMEFRFINSFSQSVLMFFLSNICIIFLN